MNGLFSVGGFGGAMFVGWACDYLGRKKTLLVACPIAIVGGALQGGAVNIAMFLVGRLLGGFAVGELRTWVSHLSPANQSFRYSRCPGAPIPERNCPSCDPRFPCIPAW